MHSSIKNFFLESRHVNLMKLFRVNEEPPSTNTDPIVPVHDWSFEKHTLILGAAEVRAVQTRSWKKEFWIVDACAGSGVVYHKKSRSWYEGSPLIYANTADRVARVYKSKYGKRRPDIKVFAIESRKETFKVLNRYSKPFDMEIRHADCNEEIKKLIEDEIPKKEFTHFFIDPFDMGHPSIQSETVKLCLERPNSEIILFFPWEQCISRLAGYVRIEDPEKQHLTGMETLTSFYFGDEKWKVLELSFPPKEKRSKIDKNKRRKSFVELYKEKLEEAFTGVNYVEIPINSTKPKYYIFFVANQITQPGIFMDMVERTRKRKMQFNRQKQLNGFLGVKYSEPKLRLPRWRNLKEFNENYCGRLLGNHEEMRIYCSMDIDCEKCLYNAKSV